MTSISSGAYYQTDRTITKKETDALSIYAIPYRYLAQKIQDFAPPIIPSIAALIANYTKAETGKAGVVESLAALRHVYPDNGELLASYPCASPDNILSILSEELSPAEKVVWGANEDGTPYCVSDIYKLVYVNPDELKTRIQKLETMLKEAKIQKYSELIKDLIEMIKIDLRLSHEKGWALISKKTLPKSENLNDLQIDRYLKSLSCKLPSHLLVHTSLLNDVLVYYKYEYNHLPLKTITWSRGMATLERPGLPFLPPVSVSFAQHKVVSFTGERLEYEPAVTELGSLRNVGFLAVRKWNFPISAMDL